MSERTHVTTWEDGGYAGTLCVATGEEGPMLSSREPPEPCPHCGATLKLRWTVYVESSNDTPQPDSPNSESPAVPERMEEE